MASVCVIASKVVVSCCASLDVPAPGAKHEDIMARPPASATFGEAAFQHEVLALHPAEIPRPLLEGFDKGPRGVIATPRLDALELHAQRPRGAVRTRPDHVRGEPDELGDFETISFTRLGGPFLPDPNATTMFPNDYVRNVLKEGLKYQPALEAELPKTHPQQEASLAALVHLTAYTTLSP